MSLEPKRPLRQSIKCLYFNAQSITNKLDDLSFVLTSDLEKSPDIVIITETWLSPNIADSTLNCANGYQIFRSDRVDRYHGGCAVLLRCGIIAKCISCQCFNGFTELLSLKLTWKGQSILLIVVYRSPSALRLADDSLIEHLLSYQVSLEVLVVGDFNLPGLYKPDLMNDVCRNFDLCFAQMGLLQKVNTGTRLDNILDLVLTTDSHLVTDLHVKEPFATSDHNSAEFNLNIVTEKSIEKKGEFFRDFRSADYDGMGEFLGTVDWANLFGPGTDVNHTWEVFTHILDFAIDRYVPIRERKFKKLSMWSKQTRKAYLAKKKLWKKFMCCRSNANNLAYRNVAHQAKILAQSDTERFETKILNSADYKSFYSFVNSKLKGAFGKK